MSKRLLNGDAPNPAKKAKMGSDARIVLIDEDLHSRQLAVYGRESMGRMADSNILICGALGLGAEIGDSFILNRKLIEQERSTSN